MGAAAAPKTTPAARTTSPRKVSPPPKRAVSPPPKRAVSPPTKRTVSPPPKRAVSPRAAAPPKKPAANGGGGRSEPTAEGLDNEPARLWKYYVSQIDTLLEKITKSYKLGETPKLDLDVASVVAVKGDKGPERIHDLVNQLKRNSDKLKSADRASAGTRWTSGYL